MELPFDRDERRLYDLSIEKKREQGSMTWKTLNGGRWRTCSLFAKDLLKGVI